MKNNREVCYAIDAGYTEFNDLPGKIKTGCPNTPAFKSRYCSIHAPFAAIPQNIEISDDGDKPTTCNVTDEGKLAAIIIGKRITRNSILYQVHTCTCTCL